jgi:CDP-4-dehydro-6-deoxyglucose reductase
VRVLSGQTSILRPEDESLSTHEVAEGLILTCCREAIEDVSLDIDSLDRLAGFETKTVPARIVSLEKLSADILRVVLRTPPASPMRFVPGQYVDVIVGGLRRSYSLANAPRADGLLELLVKRYPGGELSEYWFARASQNDLLRIEGPFGTFFLRDNPPPNILFLATGTGIAPVKALLEEMAMDPAKALGRRIKVFWGNREATNFCWEPSFQAAQFDFNRVLSGVDPDWREGRGHVHLRAVEAGFDPHATVVYACGSNEMINSARALLTSLGLSPKHFFSDAFVSSN